MTAFARWLERVWHGPQHQAPEHHAPPPRPDDPFVRHDSKGTPMNEPQEETKAVTADPALLEADDDASGPVPASRGAHSSNVPRSEDAREARYAEAILLASVERHMRDEEETTREVAFESIRASGVFPSYVRSARAAIEVADAELAPLRARVAELEARLGRCVVVTLAGFKSSNHPQQTGKRGANDEVDDRRTDPAFYLETANRFGGFTLDAAASRQNAKCPLYFDREMDGLTQSWGYHRVWVNPPYSNCGAWVRKAWAEWTRGNDGDRADMFVTNANLHQIPNRPTRIVMLLPANRVEQGWWQDYVEPFRDRPGSPLRVEFLRDRLRFDRPDWTPGPKGDRPPFGCCLLIWSPAPDAVPSGEATDDAPTKEA